jgi:hypothetical protein
MFDNRTSSNPSPASAPQGDEGISYVKEAAKLQYNLIALGGVAAFSLLSLSALPLVLESCAR